MRVGLSVFGIDQHQVGEVNGRLLLHDAARLTHAASALV